MATFEVDYWRKSLTDTRELLKKSIRRRRRRSLERSNLGETNEEDEDATAELFRIFLHQKMSKVESFRPHFSPFTWARMFRIWRKTCCYLSLSGERELDNRTILGLKQRWIIHYWHFCQSKRHFSNLLSNAALRSERLLGSGFARSSLLRILDCNH